MVGRPASAVGKELRGLPHRDVCASPVWDHGPVNLTNHHHHHHHHCPGPPSAASPSRRPPHTNNRHPISDPAILLIPRFSNSASHFLRDFFFLCLVVWVHSNLPSLSPWLIIISNTRAYEYFAPLTNLDRGVDLASSSAALTGQARLVLFLTHPCMCICNFVDCNVMYETNEQDPGRTYAELLLSPTLSTPTTPSCIHVFVRTSIYLRAANWVLVRSYPD